MNTSQGAPRVSAPASVPATASPFHADELIAQQKAGVTIVGGGIRDRMPDQHRAFFAGLRYILISAVAADGWPIATMLSGEPGFVDSPDARTLRIALSTHDRAAIGDAFAAGQEIGLLGIDLANRRRNRANGRLSMIDADGALTIVIHQSFGNCPQYIQRRTVEPALREAAPIQWLSRLDASARAMIAAADTFFVASRSRNKKYGDEYGDDPCDKNGGADISHRGGQPGFVHIEGEDLWIPDFHGNNYFNTLGNFLNEPRAALLFIDFESGDLLQLQGTVEIHWNPAAVRQFAGAERFWRFRVQRGWRRRAALPLRWTFVDAAPTTALTGTWNAKVSY
jgi:predicted pyridoxine 5'-phosphate oxidase superfamily flavin-nucleotide-binding protein